MIQPDFKTVKELAQGCGLVPIAKELLADTETPVSAYLKIRARSSPYAFLFEKRGGRRANWAILVFGRGSVFDFPVARHKNRHRNRGDRAGI